MAIWGSFVIEQEYVVLTTAKKSTTNCFIKPEVIVGEWDLKRQKSHNPLISRIILQEKVVLIMRGAERYISNRLAE